MDGGKRCRRVHQRLLPQVLIEAIRPDVLVKGADYTLDKVVGAAAVQATGGKVLLVDLLPGHSTTATIARLSA